MKNLKKVSLLLFVIFVISIFGQTATASNQNSSSESHELPILKTTPLNLESVLTDKDIKIFIDKNHKNFNRFRNHFEKGKYEVLINETAVNSLFDKNELSISILDYKLEAYNVYDLEIRLKAEKNSEASNSGNAHYSFRFYTVLNELQHMSLIKDEYGNAYKVIGYSENVKDVKIYDAKLDIDSMIDKSRRYPVSNPGSLFIDVPDDIGRVRLITEFDAEPQRVLRYNEGVDKFKLIPFSISEKGELEFSVVEDTCFIPVRYIEENLSLSKNLSLSTIGRLSALSINGSYSGDKYFNVLENEDGYLKVDITDLVNNTKSNWFAGKPSIYAEITDQKGDTKNINVSGNIIEHTFNKSGIYRVEVMEDDPLIDDVIWEQDVFVQMPFSLTSNQIANLAEKFSPIILYNNEEEYYPMSLDDIFSEIGKLDGSVDFDGTFGRKKVPFSEVGQFMAYNGHCEYLFSTSNDIISTNFKGIKGSKDSAVVYYSYFENEDKFFINYHFLYAYDPKTGTSTKPALGSHNFDRESMTLEFSKSRNIENITPENIIVGGHTDGQELTLLGKNDWWTGDTYESWKNVRVKLPYGGFKSPYSNHVVVNIAKGSHAIYPVSGWYKVLTLVEPAGITNSILSGNRLNISNERVLFPSDSQFSGEVTYTLSNSNLDNLEGGNPLIFSGDWVDLIGTGNEKFPPFTDREKDIPGWCKNASGFDLSNIPAVSKRTIEEFNKAYLFTKQTVKDLVASQDSRGIILDWTSFDGISKYKIYKRNYSGQLIETKEVAYSNYTDSDVVSGQNYIYEIEGIFKLKTDSGNTVDIACKKTAISVRYNGLIGKIKGTVKSAINNLPIANAVISVDNGAGTSIKTDAGGNFEVAVTADESHTLTVSKSGYTSVTYYNIQVGENETVHVETILQIPEEYADKTGTVTGRILNAISGQGISGVKLQIRKSMNNQSGSVVKEVFTSSNGNFTITNLQSGNYTAEVTSDNIITGYFNFVCIGGQTANRGDVPVSPRLSNSEIRIVLSWGLDPRDLDSHLTGNGIHVYYANKNAEGINLDVDDVSSYGPETITIDLGRAPKGKYSYYVHHFSGSGTLGTSGANVKVYSGNLLIKEFNVPGSISERYWYVFEIDTENGLIEGIAAASPQTQLMRTRAITDNFTEDEVSDELRLILEDIEKNKKME